MACEHTLIVSPLAAEILRFNSVPEGFKDGRRLGIHPRIERYTYPFGCSHTLAKLYQKPVTRTEN